MIWVSNGNLALMFRYQGEIYLFQAQVVEIEFQ